MALFEQISEDIKKAMLARNQMELNALRGVKKVFLDNNKFILFKHFSI